MIQKLFVFFTLATYILGVDLHENDKQKHFAISSMFAITSNQYLYHNTKFSFIKRVGYSIFLANIPGLAKEFSDSTQKNNKFDTQDIQANLLGSLLGVGLSEGFNSLYLDIKKKKKYIAWRVSF